MTIERLAEWARVDEAFVRSLIGIGALAEEGTERYGAREAHRVKLLKAWADAGLPIDEIFRMVEAGALSLSFLETPVMAPAGHLDRTYAELSDDQDVPLALILSIHEALGFAPPRPEDPARVEDVELLTLARLLLGAGAGGQAILRLFRVYADGLRRLGQAEAELYEAEIEGRLRDSGMDERQLLEYGAEFGTRVIASLEAALLAIYRRHREHIWIEHSTNHAEVALDEAGIPRRAPAPPSICFVDLTGYTRLTEEEGDRVAAELASRLGALVEDISHRRGGRPIRWLGDGGMFHFRDPRDAVLAALDMNEGAPGIGLPPTHIGIHTGPVIFQDGDVYGRTVNLASRIASHATAGQVLVSDETVERAGDDDVRFEPAGPAMLKGIGAPVPLFEAFRA